MAQQTLIDYDRLLTDFDDKQGRYRSAQPFPHIVLDEVLHADAFKRAAAEFPSIRDDFWKGYLHVNETKYSNAQPESWGPTLHDVAREFCSDQFVTFLGRLTGIDGLIPDWAMDGGGLHQTLRGGHLNIHADFTTHHQHQDWARRVNILLYLNEEWRDEWGGQLELWDRDVQECRARVTPAGNRLLVFTTAFDSFHGHPHGLSCPDDVARRSLALYYFTVEKDPIRRATNYQARPDESGMKKAAIAADRVALDLYDRAKRRLGVSDETVNRVLTRIDRLRRRS